MLLPLPRRLRLGAVSASLAFGLMACTTAFDAAPASAEPAVTSTASSGLTLRPVDMDHDGVLDALGGDQNGDGLIDVYAVDISGDGVIDGVFEDLNENGRIDAAITDLNQDSRFEAVLVDANENGRYEQVWSDFGETGAWQTTTFADVDSSLVSLQEMPIDLSGGGDQDALMQFLRENPNAMNDPSIAALVGTVTAVNADTGLTNTVPSGMVVVRPSRRF